MSKTLWRIAVEAPAYSANDLTGKGAESTGGRWNAKGTAVIYASTSISLAAMETLVHLGAGILPLNRYLVRIDVPDRVWDNAFDLDTSNVPGWDALPVGKASIDWGQRWLKSNDTLLAFVPSVIVPEERNCLINPAHADISKVKATTLRKWIYDARLGI